MTAPSDLAAGNVKFAHWLAAKMTAHMPDNVDKGNIHGEALLALVDASRRFDPSHGVQFASYAGERIRGAVLDDLRKQDWASRPARDRINAVREAEENLSTELGRPPTDDELCQALDVTSARLRQVRTDAAHAVVGSIDYLTDAGGGDWWQPADAAPSPEQHLVRQAESDDLALAVARLPEQLRTVIVRNFCDELSLTRIAEEMALTLSRVSQVRARALILLAAGLRWLWFGEEPPVAGGSRAQREMSDYIASLGVVDEQSA